ncbi:hypothetical protein BDW72DRAFT_95766 [Aspergillus terricola var. indicus]
MSKRKLRSDRRRTACCVRMRVFRLCHNLMHEIIMRLKIYFHGSTGDKVLLAFPRSNPNAESHSWALARISYSAILCLLERRLSAAIELGVLPWQSARKFAQQPWSSIPFLSAHNHRKNQSPSSCWNLRNACRAPGAERAASAQNMFTSCF